MNPAPDVISLIAEIFTWVGLVPGVVLLIIGYLQGAFAARFEQTWGVIIPSPEGSRYPWVRWMDLSRELQTAPVSIDPDQAHAVGDEVEVYFDPRDPGNGRLDDPRSSGRPLRIIGWLLTSIGALAGVAQIVLAVTE